jgi:chromosomal replication initiator protein
MAVATSPAKAYNPLFIYGGVGLGKTHLLHAIGNFIQEKMPHLKVVYITSERFAIDYVNAIRKNSFDRFRRMYRSVDVLLIDDVHFLKDKKSTQEELFHTFNELYENKRQIVLSSDRSPEDLQNLQDRLVSRFRWGLVADIQPPNLETRIAILKSKAEENSLEVPDQIIELIAQRVQSNVRSLEGALIKVVAYCELQGLTPSAKLVEEILPFEENGRPLDISIIKQEVARHYEITVEQLESESRKRRVSQARHIAIYLARELTNSSYPAIGKAFGRDHSTIMHSYQRVKEWVKVPLFRGEIEELKRLLLDNRN